VICLFCEFYKNFKNLAFSDLMKRGVALAIAFVAIALALANTASSKNGYGTPIPSVYSTDKYILFVHNNKMLSFSKEGDALYRIVDEGQINSVAIINDLNYDGYNEVLIASQNFIQPSTRIIDGKTGATVKVIPLTIKTFLGEIAYPTSKIVKKDNRIFLANFNVIYELQGQQAVKKVELRGVIDDFDYMQGRIVIKEGRELISFDSDFKNQKKKILEPSETSFLGKNSIIIVDRQQRRIRILNPSLNDVDSFSVEEYSDVIFAGENKIVLSNFAAYSFAGTKEVLGNVNKWYEKDGDFYFMQNDKLKKLTSTGVEEKYNASIPGSLVMWIDENYVIEYVEGWQESTVSLYKNKKLLKTMVLEQPKKIKDVAGDDFLISNVWPFEWKYKGYYGGLSSLPHIKTDYVLKEIVDLGDVDGDGVNEVLLEFSDAAGTEGLNALAIIYPKAKVAYEINFIPTPEELTQMINNITNKLTIINATISNKTNEIGSVDSDIAKLDSEISSLQSRLSSANESEKEEIEEEIKDKQKKKADLEEKRKTLQQEIDQLREEEGKLNFEKTFLQDPNFGRRMKIKAYTLLDRKIFLALENKMFLVGMKGEKLQELALPPETYDIRYLSSLDRNNDGKLDVVFASLDDIGVLDGVNYTLAWKKEFNQTSFSAVFTIGNKIIAALQNKMLWLSALDGAIVKEENFTSLNFIEKLGPLMIFNYEGGVLVPRESGTVKITFVLNAQQGNFVLYDCNNDNKKDLVFAGSSLFGGFIIFCIDADSGNILKKEEIKLEMREEHSGMRAEMEKVYLKKIKLHGKKLVVGEMKEDWGKEFMALTKAISGNVVIDLQNTKIDFITQSPIYYSENKIYVNEKEVQGKRIISSPYNNDVLEGDFDITFSSGGDKIIYVDGEFYGSTNENKKTIKVTSGKHQIAVLNPSPEHEVTFFDSVSVNVNRKVSKIAYFATILMLLLLAIGSILKWKRLKR
jgi:predicted  nucleic acid-binding Zn-ribbon protein